MKPRVHHSPPTTVGEPTEQQIQHAAYYLWEEEGRPVGRDSEIWFAARERLKHRSTVHLNERRGPAGAPDLSTNSIEAILAD